MNDVAYLFLKLLRWDVTVYKTKIYRKWNPVGS